MLILLFTMKYSCGTALCRVGRPYPSSHRYLTINERLPGTPLKGEPHLATEFFSNSSVTVCLRLDLPLVGRVVIKIVFMAWNNNSTSFKRMKSLYADIFKIY